MQCYTDILLSIHVISEILYEDESFEERELSALVASKVYYHLGAYDEALHYALGASQMLPGPAVFF